VCSNVVLSPSPTSVISLPSGWQHPRRVYIRSIPLAVRVLALATQGPITDPTVSQKRELRNLHPFQCLLHFCPFPFPVLPPSGSWTDRLPGLLIHQGNHDVAEQRLPSPKPLIRPNLPLDRDRQPPRYPRSDIYIHICRSRINTMYNLIPRDTPLLLSNTRRSRALSDMAPNPLTKIRPKGWRRSKSQTRTSIPLLRQRRGANDRPSAVLVSKFSQTPL
jgi:hypothetical protein